MHIVSGRAEPSGLLPAQLPRVRPFGTAHIFEGRLYIQTGKVKLCSGQLAANPKAEICAFHQGK